MIILRNDFSLSKTLLYTHNAYVRIIGMIFIIWLKKKKIIPNIIIIRCTILEHKYCYERVTITTVENTCCAVTDIKYI